MSCDHVWRRSTSRTRSVVSSARIRARFPDRRLGNVAAELGTAVPEIHGGFEESKARRRQVRLVSRVTSVAVVVLASPSSPCALRDAFTRGTEHSFDWVPLVESLINDIVFTAIAVFFLWAMPERLERRTLLDLLHRLRSLAHVVDMHQLDKDPEQARADYVPTAKSRRHRMNAEDAAPLLRLLQRARLPDRKTAALCAERTSDPVVLHTVSEIETLAAQIVAEDLAEDLVATRALSSRVTRR